MVYRLFFLANLLREVLDLNLVSIYPTPGPLFAPVFLKADTNDVQHTAHAKAGKRRQDTVLQECECTGPCLIFTCLLMLQD